MLRAPKSLLPREATFAPCPGRAATRRGFFFGGREDYPIAARPGAPSARMTDEIYGLLVRKPRFPMAADTLYKRAEKGTFAWPTVRGEEPVELRTADLMMLLAGIDLSSTRRRRWYEKKPA